MEDEIKKIIFRTIMVFAVFFFVVGCASTKNDGMKTAEKQTVIVDWSNRSLDAKAKPEWLKKLVLGNSDIFKNEFGVDNSYIVKYGIASGKTRDLALAASRVNYNAMRAEELRTKVVSEAASTLNNEGMTDAMASAAMVAKVDLSGHELVTQFWQEVETLNPETSVKTKEFICYSVYKITKENWFETLKNYMKSVLPALPDAESKKVMAEKVSSLYETTTKEVEKTESETLDEINAKLAAIETSTKTPVAPAPSSNDIEWLDILETACNIIF